jgi:hypothetical protein
MCTLTGMHLTGDKIQNAAYSYSRSWQSHGCEDAGEEDATFARLAHTEEALPGSDSLAGSQNELV